MTAAWDGTGGVSVCRERNRGVRGSQVSVESRESLVWSKVCHDRGSSHLDPHPPCVSVRHAVIIVIPVSNMTAVPLLTHVGTHTDKRADAPLRGWHQFKRKLFFMGNSSFRIFDCIQL